MREIGEVGIFLRTLYHYPLTLFSKIKSHISFVLFSDSSELGRVFISNKIFKFVQASPKVLNNSGRPFSTLQYYCLQSILQTSQMPARFEPKFVQKTGKLGAKLAPQELNSSSSLHLAWLS